MKRYSSFFAWLFIFGCGLTDSVPHGVVVLTYKDFGPPALAEPLIGNDYWQWQNHGDSRPRDNSINVIVYRDVPLAVVQKQFPVIPARDQDFRYVAYDNAIAFLEEAIRSMELHPDEISQSLAAHLKKTRDTVQAALGK